MNNWVLLMLVAAVAAACSTSVGTEERNPVLAGSGDVAAGEEAYAVNCAQCHGVDARGTDQGPTFLSDIYVPSHHADGAFLVAVRNGVAPHHWDFGPMPAVPHVSDQQVADIVAYVRSLQRDAGLIE